MDKGAADLRRRLNGGTIVGYAQFGDPHGQPLLFFHGWPGSRLQARIFDAPARLYGLKILAPDRPGIGLSTGGCFPSVAAWADTLALWIEAMDITSFYTLGISGGGPYSLACAGRMPQRIAGAGVCCGAPLPSEIDHGPGLYWLYRLLRAIDRTSPQILGLLMAGIRGYLKIMPPVGALKPMAFFLPGPDRRALHRRDNLRTVAVSTREAYRRGTAGVIADAHRLLAPWGFDPRGLSIPVHFWHGLRDRNVPLSLIKSLIRRIPEVREHYYPTDGHYSLPLNRCAEILDHLTASRPIAG